MAIDRKVICPMMQTECIEDGKVVNGELHACRFWVTVQGKDPLGKDVSQGDCSFAWLPMLLIENTKKQNETGAAVENLNNTVHAQNGAAQMALRVLTGSMTDRAALLRVPTNELKVTDDTQS